MIATGALDFRQTQTLAMTADLRRAIGLLRHNNVELTSYLLREAPSNPFVELRRNGAVLSSAQGFDNSDHERPWEHLAAEPSGLVGHVAEQIGLEIRDPTQRKIAFAFLEALEPHGWLGRSVEQIASACGCDVSDANAVLALLQGFDPPGLFARSLAECLHIQARERGILDDGLRTLIANLDLLASGQITELARLAGCTEEQIHNSARALRTLDPKPGAAFATTDQPVRPPDLLLSRGAKGWVLDLNATTLPEVIIREDLVRDAQGREDFVAEALASARGLKRAIELRNANTLAVASEMVQQQSEYLKQTDAALRPLMMQDIARAVSLHESTISRITTGLTIQTPRGVIALRALLCRGIAGATNTVSVQAVQDQIRNMIANEASKKPLSDAQITAQLKDDGLSIQRRTVAKYRAAMGIPGSARRRRTHG